MFLCFQNCSFQNSGDARETLLVRHNLQPNHEQMRNEFWRVRNMRGQLTECQDQGLRNTARGVR